jgi:DNA-binding NtrC family response regulator
VAEPIRVLWVDPDDHTFAQCVPMLSQTGWQVFRAHTFLDALELVTKEAFNFAVIEMRLPDAVGTDVWHHLKRLRPEIQGIITTTSPSLRSLISVAGPGILGYLLKPVEVDTVWHLLDQAVLR